MSESATRMDLGGVQVTRLRGGALRLDGGAMFGIIPRPLWERTTPADERHRIQLACNCLLLEWSSDTDRRAIVETGHGQKYEPKEQGIFAIDPHDWLLTDLQRRGIDPGTITDVILTHLHFDHAGGLTRQTDGRVVPTFPNARVHVTRQELDDARSGYGIMTATYRSENIEHVPADAWAFSDAENELPPGVDAVPTPGHTRGHQSIRITGRDRTLVFVGDVMPTAAHSGAPYNMAYDLFPVTNRESKRALLERAADEDWLLAIGHEPDTPIVTVTRDGNWFRLQPAAMD